MKAAAIVLFLSVSLAFAIPVVPVVHANHRTQIAVTSEKYPSLEYAEFFGLFNSILIEELRKTNGQGFATDHWEVLLFPDKRSRVRIIAIREGEGERPSLVAVLREDASFVSIRAVVEHVIETVQRGGAE